MVLLQGYERLQPTTRCQLETEASIADPGYSATGHNAGAYVRRPPGAQVRDNHAFL